MTPPVPKDDPQLDEVLGRYREDLKQRFPLPDPKPRKKRLGGKALGVLLLALGAGVAWVDPAYQREHFTTAVGQRQAVQLADGSQVVLDGKSELTVSWHLRSRQVELKRGQALFEVSPRVYRPFLVDAGTTQVKVVGTRFNVSRQAHDVVVAVAEGKVAVQGRATAATTLLEKGQQVRVHDGLAGLTSPVNIDDVAAWRDNRLVFESTPLVEAIAELERYYPRPIQLMGPGLAQLPISGTFNSEQVERLLELLPGILPLTVARGPDGSILIFPKGKEK